MSAAKKAGGRPATVDANLTPTERMDHWRQKLREDGGKEVRAYLGPGAWDALQKMAPRRERGQLIEKLIVKEYQRRNAK